jgi:hypothetical protein
VKIAPAKDMALEKGDQVWWYYSKSDEWFYQVEGIPNIVNTSICSIKGDDLISLEIVLGGTE